MSPRAKKEKEPKGNSPFTVIIRWFTEAKQYLVAFSASIVAFGVFQGQPRESLGPIGLLALSRSFRLSSCLFAKPCHA